MTHEELEKILPLLQKYGVHQFATKECSIALTPQAPVIPYIPAEQPKIPQPEMTMNHGIWGDVKLNG